MVVSFSATVEAGSRSELPDAIPSGASWVIVAHNIGRQSTTVRTILDRFKGLVAEFGNEKIASELRKSFGEDLASPEGMLAYGIDPKGSAALWADDFDHEPYVVIPISDPDRFIERLSRKNKKDYGKAGLDGPEVRGGVNIYTAYGERFAIRDGYLVLESAGGAKTGIKSFFSRGKKLGQNTSFVAVKKDFPVDGDGVMFFSVQYMRKAWRQHQKEFQKRIRGLLKITKSLASKKMFSEQLTGALKTQKSFDRLLRGFRGIGVWWKMRTNQISGGALFATTGRGQKTLAGIFPTPASIPGFHDRMLKASMMGGWLSVKPGAFVKWIGDMPQAPWITTKDELLRSAGDFRKVVGMDLFSDFIENLQQPVAGYLLVPGVDRLDTKASVENQVFSLVRMALVAKVIDVGKAKALLNRFDVVARKDGTKLHHPKVQGVGVTTRAGQGSGLEISWGENLAHIVMGIGVQPFSVLFKAFSDEPGRSSDMIGEARLDFPAFSEVVSSAVSKGIGGGEWVRFRMMWSIAKQVIGRFGSLDIKGFSTKRGLKFRAGLGMH